MAKKTGWPKGVNAFCSVTKSEVKTIPYLYLYADEFSEDEWRDYCNTVGEDPDCTMLTLYIAGVSAEFDDED